MIDDISGVTSQIVRLALDAALQRHDVIANNIANVNTNAFSPQELRFDTVLAQLENNQKFMNEQGMREKIDLLREELNRGEYISTKGADKVELDVEMADMAENVLKYRALLEGLSKSGSLIRMAISGQRS